jgi:hypothetical protein
MSENPITVCIRVRSKTDRYAEDEIVCATKKDVIILHPGKNYSSVFNFHQHFWSDEKSEQDNWTNLKLFEALGQEILTKFFQRISCTLIACGKKNSGKSYTMVGDRAHPGLFPRLMEVINIRARQLKQRAANAGMANQVQFDLTLEVVEVSMNGVKDLLINDAELQRVPPHSSQVRPTTRHINTCATNLIRSSYFSCLPASPRGTRHSRPALCLSTHESASHSPACAVGPFDPLA